jgi:iron complex transport system ATP-binding protein
MLELHSIDHAFSGETVLEDVSIEAEPGTAWALIGPNGAGKTTLIRAAAGLLEPDGGSVSIGGRPVDEMTRREVAREVSLVRQASPQTFGFSAIEVVLMGFHARTGRFSLPSDEQRERALEAMELLEIDHLADRSAPVLSGGELQRVLMARTMVAETSMWLLDEPTAHLDFRHRLTLLEQVERHRDDGGAVLAALHDLGTVDRHFDRVLVLHEGRVAASGPVDQTLSEALLGEVFDVEIRRGEVDGETVWIPIGR